MGSRPKQPVTTGAQGAQAPAFQDYAAAAGAGELLPPEAAAAAVPAGGVLTTTAAAAAVASILSSFEVFNGKREQGLRQYLTTTLTRMYPDRTTEQILGFVRDELARDREFVRNQEDRLKRDLVEAMKLPPDERGARVQAILDRERRYTLMHEKAALERAAARTHFLGVKEQSPEGAYWMLGAAKTHTPSCVAMAAAGFWPWEVLDKLHPRLHAGCECYLLGKDEAVERGFMHPDQANVDPKDALRRAAEIAKLEHIVMEAATREEIESFLDAVREADTYRLPKGAKGGGEFARRGDLGEPVVRRSIERLLRRMVPRVPSSPAERRRDGVGEWRKVAGREVFVPEHRAFEREIGGRHWYSPPGSTRVYDRGEWTRKSPAEVPVAQRERVTDTARSLIAKWDRRARDTANVALGKQDRGVLPAEVGAHPKATHQGMLGAGFRELGRDFGRQSVTAHYEHPGTGAKSDITYAHGMVSHVAWEPGIRQRRRPLLTRPPENEREFAGDVLSLAHSLAEEYDRVPQISRVRVNDAMADMSGQHGWDGVTELGPDAHLALRGLIDARRADRLLSYSESRRVYALYRTAAHEALHAAAPISQREFVEKPEARALEEGLTEEVAATVVIDMLRRQGLTDVLRWVKANPTDLKVMGFYSHYRRALSRIFDRAGVPPESRENLIHILKFSFEPEQRLDGLAALVAGADRTLNHAEAREWARDLLVRAVEFTERDLSDMPFTPNVRPDLSDVPDEPPVMVRGAEVHPGSRVQVKGHVGVVQVIHRLDGGPLFDVEYGPLAGLDFAVHPEEIESVLAAPPGSSDAGSRVRVGGQAFGPGDRISYLSGSGRTMATVERIIRVAHPGLARAKTGWQMEARTDDGDAVLLDHGRAPGLRREGMASPGGERFRDPNTTPVRTGLGPVTFSSVGDQVGPEYHATYTAKLADGSPVGTLSVAYLGDTASIQMIDVPEQYRRNGVASALVQRVRNEQPGVKIETLGDVTMPEGRAFIASGRRSHYSDVPEEGLTDEGRVSVAENVMERSGLDGGKMGLSIGHADDPDHQAQNDALSAEAQKISGDPGLRVSVTNWISGPDGSQGQALYDGVFHRISLRPTAKKLTFLHEIAHAVTRTNHGVGGHGPEFQEAAARLYGEHISPEAEATFRRLATAPLREADSTNDFPLALGAPAGSAMMLGKQPEASCLYCDRKAKFLVVNQRGVRPACGRHVSTAKDDPLAQVRLLDPYDSKFLTDTKVHVEKPGSKIYSHSTVEQGNPSAPDSWVTSNEDDVEESVMEERAARGRPGKPQSCKYGSHPATKSLLWAEGRAFVPVCDDHERTARDKIEGPERDEVIAVVPIRDAVREAVEQEISRVANEVGGWAGPDYGQAAWNAETRAVYWNAADYTSAGEVEAARRAFLDIDGVDSVMVGEEGPPCPEGFERIVLEGEFEEMLHPRGRGGKWVKKGWRDLVAGDRVRHLRTGQHGTVERVGVGKKGVSQGASWVRVRWDESGSSGRVANPGMDIEHVPAGAEWPKEADVLVNLMRQFIALRVNALGDKAGGMSYVGFEDYVLKHGMLFHHGDKTERLEREFHATTPQECFANALMAAVSHPDLTYVEGFAFNGLMPVHHAWVVDKEGTVYDPTWESIPGHAQEDSIYIGVPFKTDYVTQTVMRKGSDTLLDWQGEGVPLDKPPTPEMIEPGVKGLPIPKDRQGPDPEALVALRKGERFGLAEADYEEFLHPRGRQGRWIDKLYHGTNVKLVPGDIIRPGGVGRPELAYHRPDLVYMSAADHLAERYAVARAGKSGGDPHVYEVEPLGEVLRDPEFEASGFGADQWASPAPLRVVREIPLPGTVHWDAESASLHRGRAS